MIKMKIYIYRYGSICEPDIIDSFRRLGFDVDEETVEMENKKLLPSECINITSEKITHGNYQFVFTINFFPWLSYLCNIANVKYISLIVDSPVIELYSDAITNKCNYIFTFDNAQYMEFYNRNPDHIFHIPLAANTVRTSEIINNADNNIKQKYSCDISFIGSTYQEKCPYNQCSLPDYERGLADGIIEAQLKVYGYNFIEEIITDEFVDCFIKCNPDMYKFPDKYDKNYKAVIAQQYLSVKTAEQERIRALTMLSENFNVDLYTGSDTTAMPHIHNKGFAKTHTEMPIIFNQSKINLNITAKSIRTGLPLRIFDVLGCGGFLITNYQAELPQYFDIGTELVAYDSFEDLKEKCNYYLSHEDERKQIALNGYNKVQQLHTFDKRLVEILEAVFG